MEMQVIMVDLDKVVPDSGQPRKNFPQAHINALVESIKSRGLKNPIHVQPSNGDGTHTIINGECRTRACKILGWTEIPAIIFKDQLSEEIFMDQILDNVVRKDMDIMETVQAYQKALDMDVPITDLAKAFGCSVNTIEKDLPLLNLPDTLKRDVDQKVMSKEIGRKLADLHPEFSDAQIKDAWKHARRAPSVEGQSKRLEVWKAVSGGLKSVLEEAKEDTTKAERKKFAKALGTFMTSFGKFSKNHIEKNSNFLSSAMMHLTKEVNSGQVKKDLDYCYSVLDSIKDSLVEFQAHKT